MSIDKNVCIQSNGDMLQGILHVPEGATGIVLFAHGSGSGRLSSRNQFVAKRLQKHGLATLLMDLLTQEEEAIDETTRQFRFDIDLLSKRLVGATKWLKSQKELAFLSVGYFGASTGAAAALVASSFLGTKIKAVVSRGGRPDLADPVLNKVSAPTLLIVGGNDFGVIELNQSAYESLQCQKRMEIVPGATHLFEEPGTLEQVSELAAKWFVDHL